MSERMDAMTKSETVAEMPDLETALGQLHDAVARHKRGREDAIQAAIDGGLALAALRDRAQHGDWGRWVRRAGLTERTAHNWRRLAAMGMTAEQVVERGGMRAVLTDHLAEAEKAADRCNGLILSSFPFAKELEKALESNDTLTLTRLLPDFRSRVAKMTTENMRAEHHLAQRALEERP